MFHNKAVFRATLLALFLPATSGTAWSQSAHCGSGISRLVPNDYNSNSTQFNSVCLPEAWSFMKNRWQQVAQPGVGSWPYLVVIDDGFFTNNDSPVRPEIHKGYPDGTGQFPDGTAWGHIPPPTQVAAYGYHGTAVLSLLSSTANNSFLISGVAGRWDNITDGSRWGARFIPVRVGKGILAPPTPSLLAQIFQNEVLPWPQARVVNISQTLVDVSQPAGSALEIALQNADIQQVVVVTGAGNGRQKVKSTRWVRKFANVIVVGALNWKGTDLWIENATTGTATGDGVDLYAPGEDLTVVPSWSTTVQDSGTSYAAPLVAGVAAMMQNVEPGLDSWEVRDILVNTGDLVTPSTGGAAVRRLNAIRALMCVDVVQRWTSWTSTGEIIRSWSCDLGSFGSASGSRVGW